MASEASEASELLAEVQPASRPPKGTSAGPREVASGAAPPGEVASGAAPPGEAVLRPCLLAQTLRSAAPMRAAAWEASRAEPDRPAVQASLLPAPGTTEPGVGPGGVAWPHRMRRMAAKKALAPAVGDPA